MTNKTLPPLRIRDATAFGKVAVLLGGWSAEREISLRSGAAVLEGLRARGVDAHPVDPKDGFQSALLDGGFDRAWIALHGRGGEDGTVQGALEYLSIPYTGSGVLGSAIGMDKVRTKQAFLAAGLKTPPYAVLKADDPIGPVVEHVGLPMAVKPAHEGSSIGMTRVDDAGVLEAAVGKAREFDRTVLLESWVSGPEYTATVLGNVVLPMIRIETPRTFYDYEAKYAASDTQYHCPSGLSDSLESEYALAVLAAFNAVGARGWGRVDFMMSDSDEPLFLEVNTLPGMTNTSLVPMSAAQMGCDFEELVWRILETSFVEGEH
ncbi:MAG: D-alanine--D-alanine ligase [Gammaproteobacteria bacterium]